MRKTKRRRNEDSGRVMWANGPARIVYEAAVSRVPMVRRKAEVSATTNRSVEIEAAQRSLGEPISKVH